MASTALIIIEHLISTIIVYMTTTNNKGLIPSLFFFYPTISCEGGKIYFFEYLILKIKRRCVSIPC